MAQEPGAKRGITDSIRRLLDQRVEERSEGSSQNAVLVHDGKRHVVGVLNLSGSGAMIRYHGALADGDQVVLHLLDHGAVTGQVRWHRDGRVGVEFAAMLDEAKDQG